jgi:hypothetical protein
MKFLYFIFDPDIGNYPPWHSLSPEQLLARDMNHNFLVYKKNPDEYGKQEYWITEDVKLQFTTFLERYELTPVHLSLENLKELGAKSALPGKLI